MKKSTKLVIISIIILDFFMCVSLFILYGPWEKFRTFWITTAMTTMNHQYLARWFYSEKTIAEVMANNYIIEVDEDTDTSLIDSETENIVIYEDEFEEQVLKRNKENDLYKVIDIKKTGLRGYLVVVYDPSKISLAMTKYLGTRGQTLDIIAKDNNARVAINASGFPDPEDRGDGAVPTGSVIKDGKIIYTSPSPGMNGGIIGFDMNNNLILTRDTVKIALTKYNLRDAVEFGPFLIVNGKESFIKGNGGWGEAPRTVIGQRSDGIVLFLLIDGKIRVTGANMIELTQIMKDYKAINAANLDGGASSSLIVENQIANKPAGLSKNGLRRLPNAWIIKD
jgi:exopolysaccharide biosynthesis protein